MIELTEQHAEDDDYAQAGQPDPVLRSGISASSCFWCSGDKDRARPLFATAFPSRSSSTQIVLGQARAARVRLKPRAAMH